ncbi:beta-fructofuranosidase-like protein [Diplonema papillatum]|nr:beta-fructofuranosidase-like protein [Diplonema papillatum]
MPRSQCVLFLLVGALRASASFVPGTEVEVSSSAENSTHQVVATRLDGRYVVAWASSVQAVVRVYEANGTLYWEDEKTLSDTVYGLLLNAMSDNSVSMSCTTQRDGENMYLNRFIYAPDGSETFSNSASPIRPYMGPLVGADIGTWSVVLWPGVAAAYNDHMSFLTNTAAGANLPLGYVTPKTEELYTSVSVVGVPKNSTFYIAYATANDTTTLYYKQAAAEQAATDIQAEPHVEYELAPGMTGGFRLASLAYTVDEIRIAFATNEGFAVGVLVPPSAPVLKAGGYVTNPGVVCLREEETCLYFYETNTSGTFDIIGIFDDAITGWSDPFAIANTSSTGPVNPQADVSDDNDGRATFFVVWNGEGQGSPLSLRLLEIAYVLSTRAPPTDAPPTTAPSTSSPPTHAPTSAPPTTAPPTDAPSTSAPPTSAPTMAPPTDAPSTRAPLTAAPPTGAPSTSAPPTSAPTGTPLTGAPATPAPPTHVPTMGPTAAPATKAPPAGAPAPQPPVKPSAGSISDAGVSSVVVMSVAAATGLFLVLFKVLRGKAPTENAYL